MTSHDTNPRSKKPPIDLSKRARHATPAELDDLIGAAAPDRTARALAHLELCTICSDRLVARIEEAVLDEQGATENVAPFVAFLRRAEPWVRASAARAAVALAFQSAAADAALRALLGDPDDRVRDAARDTLKVLRPAPAAMPATPSLRLVVPARIDFDRDGDYELALSSGTTLSMRVGVDHGREATVTLPAGASLQEDTDAIAVRLIRDDGQIDVRFLNRQGRAVFPLPIVRHGSFRIDVGRTVARCAAARFTATRAAAAPFEDKPNEANPNRVATRHVVEAPDGSMTLTVIEHPGGFLEVHAQAHRETLRRATVHVQFKTKEGEAIPLRGEGGTIVNIAIALNLTRQGEPFGAWMEHVNFPDNANHIDFVAFSADDASR